MPTKDNLLKRGIPIDGVCFLYENKLETQEVIFMNCELCVRIWLAVFLESFKINKFLLFYVNG